MGGDGAVGGFFNASTVTVTQTLCPSQAAGGAVGAIQPDASSAVTAPAVVAAPGASGAASSGVAGAPSAAPPAVAAPAGPGQDVPKGGVGVTIVDIPAELRTSTKVEGAVGGGGAQATPPAAGAPTSLAPLPGQSSAASLASLPGLASSAPAAENPAASGE